MHISTLPDLCLMEIFSNQTLHQQLRNVSVCSRWQQVQRKLFRSQKAITMVVGGPEDHATTTTDETIKESEFSWHHVESLPKMDRKRRSSRRPIFNLTKDFLRVNVALLNQEESFGKLRILFPNLAHVRVGFVEGPPSAMLESL